MGNKNPNTSEIIRLKKEQSRQKKEAVLKTLEEMLATNAEVSKAEICRRSGVSKTFLYSHAEELLEPINNAIAIANTAASLQKRQKREISDKSKEKIIEALRRKNEVLQRENHALRRENEILLGKLAMEQYKR